jgi:hypothetical protein
MAIRRGAVAIAGDGGIGRGAYDWPSLGAARLRARPLDHHPPRIITAAGFPLHAAERAAGAGGLFPATKDARHSAQPAGGRCRR